MHALLALAFGYFVTGTGAFIVAGLLNEIGADLGVSNAAAGQLLSVYSLALAAGAPMLARLAMSRQRRNLIAGALALFGLLQVAAATAPNLGVLAAERILTGLAAAAATPQAIAVAGLMAPAEQRGHAIATLFLGFSLSIVLGVPLGTMLGSAFGWRATLGLIGALSLASAAWIRLVLPGDLPLERVDGNAWRKLADNAALLWVLATTVLNSAGQFTLFTYLAPAFKSSLQADAYTIGLLFGVYGVCGVVGNFVASRIIDGIGNGRVVGICLALMTAAFMLWPIADGSIGLTIFVVALWGLGGFAVHPAQQARLVAIEPSLSSTSLALNLSGTYLGQALGGATGGALVASTGTAALPWAGLIALLAACGAAFMASATPEHAACPTRKL